jgi:hypothetical protein
MGDDECQFDLHQSLVERSYVRNCMANGAPLWTYEEAAKFAAICARQARLPEIGEKLPSCGG